MVAETCTTRAAGIPVAPQWSAKGEDEMRTIRTALAIAMALGVLACEEKTTRPKTETRVVAPPGTTTSPTTTTATPPTTPPTTATPTPTPPTVPKVQETTEPKVELEKLGGKDTLALARKLLEEGESEDALIAAKRATKKMPESFLAWNTLGRAELALNHGKEAQEAFEKAVELRPRSSHAHNNLGLTYLYE